MRRRKIRLLIFACMLLALALCVYGVGRASYLPQLSVRTITVVGAKHVPVDLVRHEVDTVLHDGSYHFLSRANIFLYPQSEIEQAVKKFFPRFKYVKVAGTGLFSSEIVVTVEEREQYAQWCETADENCYSLDSDGFIYAEHKVDSENLMSKTRYVFHGGIVATSPIIGQTFAAGHLRGFVVLLDLLGGVGFNPYGATVENQQDFSIFFDRGFSVKVSYGQDVNMLVKNLQLVLSSQPLKGKEDSIEYIDLRFDNRVYYKMKGEAAVTDESN